MRDVADSLVCHESVAENGVIATVRTSEIDGGGPLGVAGAVDVVVVPGAAAGAALTGTLAPVGKARNVRSRAYGAPVWAVPSPIGASVTARDAPSTPESRCRPIGASRPV